MTWVWVIATIVVGLFLSAFFSGAETGLYRVNRLRLHLGVRRRDPVALRLSSILSHQQGALCVTLIGTNVANFVTTLAVSFLFADLLGCSPTHAELYTVAALTPVVFVFGEMVPKTLFQLYPDRLLARGSRLFAVSDRVLRMTGMVWVLTALADRMNRLVGVRAEQAEALEPKRRVANLLHEGIAGDSHSTDQSALIDRVCRLSETPLHAVMVPRNRVRFINDGAGRRELLRAARRTGHARLPVYKSSSRHIVGIVKIDELLQSDDWQTVGEKMQPPLTLRPHHTVATTIARLRQEGRRMAIITDRGGQMIGIVTLKDLLREVVGEVASGM